jgi:hypothetical protein
VTARRLTLITSNDEKIQIRGEHHFRTIFDLLFGNRKNDMCCAGEAVASVDVSVNWHALAVAREGCDWPAAANILLNPNLS